MERLATSVFLILVVLLEGTGCQLTTHSSSVFIKNAGQSSSLPVCRGSPTKNRSIFTSWSDCFGTQLNAYNKTPVYIGEWKNGKRDGEGTIGYGDVKYVGELKNGLRHGQGTQYFSHDVKYVGGFKQGQYHGQGTINFGDRREYVGGWKNGVRHGQGAETYRDGRKYVGEYMDSMKHGQGTETFADGRVNKGIFENNRFKNAQKVTPIITASPPPTQSSVERENERLRRENARLKEKRKPKRIAKKTNPNTSPPIKTSGTGSGFFVSKLGHIITNEHVVRGCVNITVGDNAKTQVTVTLVETDKRNDLALLKISSTKMASADTKSLIKKLGIKIVPLASEGLFRSGDVELGEDVLVSGYPYGDIFSNSIKVTKGIVSANRGMGNDTGQFQMDAAVQPGNSGGPIYDENGNIVGVVVAQLNKLKVAKAIGSLPENVNFGIKASTVRQFLIASGLPTKWSNRSKGMITKDLAKIAKNQTVMVMCNR
jgi:S1-C subfamily serine protease